ncbi:MAG: hypothetical protein ACXWCZ_00470, partial [Flavisolibacter sp.]
GDVRLMKVKNRPVFGVQSSELKVRLHVNAFPFNKIINYIFWINDFQFFSMNLKIGSERILYINRHF